jgi:hypothetical protein
MKCLQGDLGRPSLGLSGPCISSHRTRVRKPSQRFVSLKAFSTEETNQRLRQSSANVPSSNQWIITQPTLRLLIIRPLRAFCLAQTLAFRPKATKHRSDSGGQCHQSHLRATLRCRADADRASSCAQYDYGQCDLACVSWLGSHIPAGPAQGRRERAGVCLPLPDVREEIRAQDANPGYSPA